MSAAGHGGKDTGAIKDEYKDQNKVWQMRVYNKPLVKQVVNMFIPSEKSLQYRKNVKLMKDAATKQKMETLYVNRIGLTIVAFLASLLLVWFIHTVAIDYIYSNPVSDYDLIGGLSEKDLAQL